ncbi:uncharacterized protein LOC119664210 [Teleopsis dalmanni]|uniref:uncharacterized protein LOC119664210 n=1 Tax=Teleopsis dalmanni TaxID=139649 RepID=UPI0018CD37EC|nr:uncharacterized protein LOC119664210 [Teleopsis dalmanni]
MLLSLLFLPLVLGNSVNVTRFDNNLGIYFESIGLMKVATAEWKMIVYYDLHPYWTEIDSFKNGTKTIKRLCSELQAHTACTSLYTHFKHVRDELLQDQTLLYKSRNKRAAINIVGNIAHTLFGVLDSDYAESMSDTINQLNSRDDYAMQLIHNQTSIIDSTINIIKRDEVTMQSRMNHLQKQVDEFLNRIGTTTEQIHVTQLLLSLSAELTLMVSNLQHIQSEIIDVLTDTHHGKISPLLLTPDQLTKEINRIKGHLPSSRTLPFTEDNLTDFYKLMKVKSTIKNQHVLFLIQLPLLDKQQFELFKTTPIPVVINKTMIIIKTEVEYLATNTVRDQYIPFDDHELRECFLTKDNIYLCANKQTRLGIASSVRSCEINLFNGNQSTTCNIIKLQGNIALKQLHNPNQWLYATKLETLMSASCETYLSQFSLKGSGMLTFEPTCIIKNAEITIHGHYFISSIVSTSFPRFGNLSTVVHINEMQKIFNTTPNDVKTQLKELTELQGRLTKENLTYLPSRVRLNSIHHHTISYLALLISITIIIIITWKTKHNRCQKHTISEISTRGNDMQNAELRQQNLDFTVTTT